MTISGPVAHTPTDTKIRNQSETRAKQSAKECMEMNMGLPMLRSSDSDHHHEYNNNNSGGYRSHSNNDEKDIYIQRGLEEQK